jgi:hypothetical protein
VLVDPVLVDPVSALPEAVSVGLVLAPPAGPCELDAGGAGVEELLPGVVDDAVALGWAFLDGVAVSVGQGAAVAFADVLPFLALLLAFAEAVEVAVLVALADPVPVAVAVDVAVVVSLGPVLPPAVPLLDPLSVALLGWPLAGLLAGVTLGVADLADLAGLAAEDDGEPDTHAGVSLLLWGPEVLPGPVPLAPELYWVPAPLALGAPLPVPELVIPTAELSWATASRSGGTASATPMANTTHAAARAGRSSPYRQSRCCRG